jgi:hypothetical protein
MAKPFIRPSTLADVHYLAENLSTADIQEVHACSGASPLQAVHSGFVAGQCYTVDLDGDCIVMFGVNGPKGGPAAPWMLCTDDISKATGLVREARRIVQRMLQNHSFLANFAWSKNLVHLKWIMWLGFEFNGRQHIANGETFLWFEKTHPSAPINRKTKGGTDV